MKIIGGPNKIVMNYPQHFYSDQVLASQKQLYSFFLK